MWLLCGLYREVYVFAEPKKCVRDFFITTDLDKDYNDSDTTIEIKVNDYAGSGSATVKAEIIDGDERILLGEADFNGSANLKFNKLIENPKKWSAESPYLYNPTRLTPPRSCKGLLPSPQIHPRAQGLHTRCPTCGRRALTPPLRLKEEQQLLKLGQPPPSSETLS